MHCTSFAPELSATPSTDSVWIMSAQLLCGALDEAHDFPALLFRVRLVLDDLNAIAGAKLVGLVVSLVALTHAHVLLVHGVHLVAHDFDDHRLVHLVALDATDQPSAGDPLATARVRGGFSAHDLPPSLLAA